jgi:hypothetical protein
MVLKTQTSCADPSHSPLVYDSFCGILTVTSLLLHQERRATETPLEEVPMVVSQQVLCVVTSFLLIAAASPVSAKPKDKHLQPPRNGLD